jgi:hypothetical protein
MIIIDVMLVKLGYRRAALLYPFNEVDFFELLTYGIRASTSLAALKITPR